jgi:NAD(P)-dependent dehydrogenase (short-subunit alcohol dehydrogenase family)
MLPKGSGSIVNITSVYGKQGAAGASVYVASKHAVEGLTKSAALELATTGIRVNAVAPGPIKTGMLDRFAGSEENKAHLVGRIPLRRIGTADEIAAAVTFLALGKATYMTGHSLSVDGGAGAG